MEEFDSMTLPTMKAYYTLASFVPKEGREGNVIPSDGIKIWKKGLQSRDEARKYAVENSLPTELEYIILPTFKIN